MARPRRSGRDATTRSGRPGRPRPTNFAVWAPEGNAAWVCLFDDAGEETRHRLTERSLGIWHGAVPGVAVGTRYGYRVAGPWAPEQGLRFNPAKLLLDPYARAISGELDPVPAVFGYDARRRRERDDADSAAYVPKSVVVDDRLRLGGRRSRCSGAGATRSSTSCTSRA